MLVLGRTKGQRILVNGGADQGGITICLVEIRGSTIKIGIEASQDYAILREEFLIESSKRPQPVSQEVTPSVHRGEAG